MIHAYRKLIVVLQSGQSARRTLRSTSHSKWGTRSLCRRSARSTRSSGGHFGHDRLLIALWLPTASLRLHFFCRDQHHRFLVAKLDDCDLFVLLVVVARSFHPQRLENVRRRSGRPAPSSRTRPPGSFSAAGRRFWRPAPSHLALARSSAWERATGAGATAGRRRLKPRRAAG